MTAAPRPTPPRRPGGFVLLALVVAACGYTQGSGLSARGVRTVALEVIGNETFRQRLEVELGAALARELPVSSDLVLADRRRADARLQVVFATANEGTLVPGFSDPRDPTRRQFVREGAFEATVQVRLVRPGGEVVLQRQVLDRTEFHAALGEDLTTARAELVDDLARKIALALATDF